MLRQSQYYKVREGEGSKDYEFTPVLENEVPDSLKNLTFKNKDTVTSFMPHIKTEKDFEREQIIKEKYNLFTDNTLYNHTIKRISILFHFILCQNRFKQTPVPKQTPWFKAQEAPTPAKKKKIGF